MRMWTSSGNQVTSASGRMHDEEVAQNLSGVAWAGGRGLAALACLSRGEIGGRTADAPCLA